MRVSELKAALDELQRLFSAGGARTVASDLKQLADLVEFEQDRDLTEYLSDVQAKLAPPPPIDDHVKRLREADDNERAFKIALEALRADKMMSKDHVIEVAKKLEVIRLSLRSRPAAIESIEKHFYWVLNNRDADALSKRATPW